MNPIVHKQTPFQRRQVEVEGVKRDLFVASTDTPDRMEDIVDQNTWKLDNYKANPVVQVNHDYRVEATVGRGEALIGDRMLGLDVVKWSSKPLAQQVKQDVEDEIISAVSVGFRPGRMIPRSQLPKEDPRYGERGYVFYDCELLEVSIVAIPANPEALAARSLAVNIDEIVAAAVARELEAHRLAQPEPAPRGLSHLFPSTDGLAHLFPKE